MAKKKQAARGGSKAKPPSPAVDNKLTPPAQPVEQVTVRGTLPSQPKMVGAAIAALIDVECRANCVAELIEEGHRWQWEGGEPKSWRPVPPKDEYVAERRAEVESQGVQAWSKRHQAGAEAAWEDHVELHAERERHVESFRAWRSAILEYWNQLHADLIVARESVVAIREPLEAVVAHPGVWISDLLASLGHLSALGVRLGSNPWVGDPTDFRGPLVELSRRRHFLQNAAFVEGDGGPPKDLINHEQAAEVAQVSAGTIRRWLTDGKVTGYGEHRKVSRAEIEEKTGDLRQRMPRAKNK